MPSRAIADYEYDDERWELLVRYRSGRAYIYHEVPADEFAAMTAAESKGKFVNEVIKPRYRYTEVVPS